LPDSHVPQEEDMPDLVSIETFSDAHKLDEVDDAAACRAQKHQGPRHEPRPPPPVQPNPAPDDPAPPNEEDDTPAQEPEKIASHGEHVEVDEGGECFRVHPTLIGMLNIGFPKFLPTRGFR